MTPLMRDSNHRDGSRLFQTTSDSSSLKKTGAVPPAAPWLQLDEPVICCNKVSQLNVKGMERSWNQSLIIDKDLFMTLVKKDVYKSKRP